MIKLNELNGNKGMEGYFIDGRGNKNTKCCAYCLHEEDMFGGIKYCNKKNEYTELCEVCEDFEECC